MVYNMIWYYNDNYNGFDKIWKKIDLEHRKFVFNCPTGSVKKVISDISITFLIVFDLMSSKVFTKVNYL